MCNISKCQNGQKPGSDQGSLSKKSAESEVSKNQFFININQLTKKQRSNCQHFYNISELTSILSLATTTIITGQSSFFINLVILL